VTTSAAPCGSLANVDIADALARIAGFEFIQGWYNPHRRHSSLGRKSPNEFERSHALRKVPEGAELST
jgi:transposase InsO family protein